MNYTTERFQHVLTNLVHSFEVVAHGWVCMTRIVTTLHRAVIHGALVVNLRVLLQVALVLKPMARRKERDEDKEPDHVQYMLSSCQCTFSFFFWLESVFRVMSIQALNLFWVTKTTD